MAGLSQALLRDVRKLRAAHDAESRERGSMNVGDTVEVEYFALSALLTYFDETRHAAARVVRARNALHQLFFSSGTDVDSGG